MAVRSSKPKAAAPTPVQSKPSRAGKATLISSKLAFKGKVFEVYRDTIIEPGGYRHVKDVVRHNGSVVILAIDETADPQDPDVILERQYRHAAGQFLIELPAGKIDAGETALAAAKREMIEETGYRVKEWTKLVKYFASPGFIGEWMEIYLARGISAGVAQPEADEQIEIHRMKLSEAMALLNGGKIHDGKTIIGLSMYDAGRRAGRF